MSRGAVARTRSGHVLGHGYLAHGSSTHQERVGAGSGCQRDSRDVIRIARHSEQNV